MDKRETVVMNRAQLEALRSLPSVKDVQSVIAAVIEFGLNGNESPELPQHLQPLWIMFRAPIEENLRRYADACEKRSNAGKIGNAAMRANASNREQSQAIASKREQTQANASKREQTQDEYDNEYEYDTHPLSNESVCDSAGARTHAKSSGQVKKIDYPKSTEDVLALAKAINLDMSPEQAEKYYLYRKQRQWRIGTGSGEFQLRPENVPENMRLWVNGDKAEAARGKAAEINNEGDEYYGVIGGKYIPRH